MALLLAPLLFGVAGSSGSEWSSAFQLEGRGSSAVKFVRRSLPSLYLLWPSLLRTSLTTRRGARTQGAPTLVSKYIYWADEFWAFDPKHIFGRAALNEAVNKTAPVDFVYSGDGGASWRRTTEQQAVPFAEGPGSDMIPLAPAGKAPHPPVGPKGQEPRYFYLRSSNYDPAAAIKPTGGAGTPASPWRAAVSESIGLVSQGAGGLPLFSTEARQLTFDFSSLPAGFCNHTLMRSLPVDLGGAGAVLLPPHEDGGGYVLTPIMFLCQGSNTSKEATSVVAMRSDASGKKWKSTAVIAHAKDFHTTEGANENALVRLKDGELMSVIRFGAGYRPWTYYYQSFSQDHVRTMLLSRLLCKRAPSR